MTRFVNKPSLGDWVVYCDLCGTPCKASESGMKSAGINDNSLLLCKRRCYDKWVVNPQTIYPTPVIKDPTPAPIVRSGFDDDFVTPPFVFNPFNE